MVLSGSAPLSDKVMKFLRAAFGCFVSYKLSLNIVVIELFLPFLWLCRRLSSFCGLGLGDRNDLFITLWREKILLCFRCLKVMVRQKLLRAQLYSSWATQVLVKINLNVILSRFVGFKMKESIFMCLRT